MKFLILALALLSPAAYAGQATCFTSWGTPAKVSWSGNKLSLRFTNRYRSATLDANGQTRKAFYYRSTYYQALAIVEKSVIQNGRGSISYRYQDDGLWDRPQMVSVRLSCR